MSTQTKIKTLASFIFFALSILLFSLAIQKTKTAPRPRADEGEVKEVDFDKTKGHGNVTQSFGFILSDITNNDLVNEIDSKFKNTNIYLKILAPTVDTIDDPNFAKLSASGFKWYFSFNDYEETDAMLAKYYATYQNDAVIELTDYSKLDVAQVNALLTKYPKVKFHAAQFSFWPREQVKELYTKIQPPQLNAASIFVWVDHPDGDVKNYVKTMFDTFYDASGDVDGGSNIKINYPANSALSLSDIRTNPTGDAKVEQARRFSVITSAIVTAIQTQGDTTKKAPIKYIIAGDYSKMSAAEKNMLVAYATFIKRTPDVLWPKADSVNGDAMNQVFPFIGVVGYESNNNKYFGFITNISNAIVTAHLPDEDFSAYASYSNLRGPGSYISTDKKITLQGYETVAFYGAPGPEALQVGSTAPTATPTSVAGGGTPFPTFPPIPTQAKGTLICDPGPDPYHTDTIIVYNDTGTAINDLTSYVHRCKYEKNKIKVGFYKCETSATCDANDENCDPGVWDQEAGTDFSLAAGATKVLKMTVNPCEIAQLDVQNADTHVDDSLLECTNIRSGHTVEIGKRWPGGIGFAIGENATGYNDATGICTPPPTNTPTPPVDIPTDTPTVPPTIPPTNPPTVPPTIPPTNPPTVAPTASNTPTPTNTPTSTPTPPNTPIPTNTPLPTYTPIPTSTPIKNLTVKGQPPGSTPWTLIGIPIGLILIGLFL